MSIIRSNISVSDSVNIILVTWIVLLSLWHIKLRDNLIESKENEIKVLKELNIVLGSQLLLEIEISQCRERVEFMDEFITERRLR